MMIYQNELVPEFVDGYRARRSQVALMGGRPPTASMCQSGGVDNTTLKEASVTEVSTIGLDIAKQLFHVRGADASGHSLFHKKIVRAKVLAFFPSQPGCVVAMETCGGAHYWGRQARPYSPLDTTGLRQAVRETAEERCGRC